MKITIDIPNELLKRIEHFARTIAFQDLPEELPIEDYENVIMATLAYADWYDSTNPLFKKRAKVKRKVDKF